MSETICMLALDIKERFWQHALPLDTMQLSPVKPVTEQTEMHCGLITITDYATTSGFH